MSAVSGDHSVKPTEQAAAEFYIRCRLSSPLKSWFSPKELAEPCGTSPQQAGSTLSSVIRRDVDGYEVETRPGGRGGTKYGFRRVDEDALEERRFWIERGERTFPVSTSGGGR